MAVLFLASFMNLIDVSIVNVALPQIQADTGATATQLEWVAAIYVLALAVGLLPFGRFGDVFGRRCLFIWGLIGFTVSSAVCGLAPDVVTLIAARAVKGIAAAMMVPQVLAIAHVIFPAEEKSRVFGLFGTVSSLAVVAGPIIGGALISADIAGLGWRLAFLINIPLGIAALIGIRIFVPLLDTDSDAQSDWIGTSLFTVAAVLLVLPLIEGRALGWPWWCFAALFSAIPATLAFVAFEHRRSANGLSALMPPGLLSNGPYLRRLGLVTLFFSGVPGLFLVLAIFLQSGFGLTALQSGLVTTPFPVGVMLASMTTERFGNRYLSARIAGGAALLMIGMVALQLVIRSIGADLNPYAFTLPLLVCGFGMGTAIMSLFQVTMSSVEPQDAGGGSGAMQAFQQIGAALGIAIAGQIFFGLLGEKGMAAGAATAPRFVEAAAMATTYSIAVFATLTVLVGVSAWRTRRDKTGRCHKPMKMLPGFGKATMRS
ncbi:MFS transporter [Litoreibacter roseus]|uniref:Putative actinorhodin transporter n=1 Tax=Litoreibacter roseus TaxID=2601869 RepID=A0A6N6JL16_9RHOB|nr:MFS transporter [Litoreibacter roseus]GFE66560.1 putative actinorhodin transporter [Litoreibacter roseus]